MQEFLKFLLIKYEEYFCFEFLEFLEIKGFLLKILYKYNQLH